MSGLRTPPPNPDRTCHVCVCVCVYCVFVCVQMRWLMRSEVANVVAADVANKMADELANEADEVAAGDPQMGGPRI